MKKIIELIFQPFKFFASKNIAESISNFLGKRPYLQYILTTLITLIVIFLKYYR